MDINFKFYQPSAGPENRNKFVNRLNPIEGLRAWLAIWVLAGHVLVISGYEADKQNGFAWLLGQNLYAVDVFIMVSGFVIFFLLDQKKEAYGEFICRRFFRLYPVFIILFALSIPFSFVQLWNLQHSHQYLTPWLTSYFTREFNCSWQHWRWNVLWHLVMLHGLVPDPWLNRSTALAFLGPAWSISLEWQFYLIAPLAFAAAVSQRPMHRIGICVFCLYLFLGRNLLPQNIYIGYITHGAFLPFHVEYFFIGAVSYFIFKNLPHPWADVFFPVSACAAMFLWHSSGNKFIPIYFWILFMGLLCENPAAYSTRILSPLFNHPIAQFLGRISYSIYLSHVLIMTAAQYMLLRYLPGLPQRVHFWTLLAATTAGTILVSALLYRYVEAPGIRLGRKLAPRLRKIGRDIRLTDETTPA